MIDVSDGLAVDLGRLIGASGMGAQVDVADVPLTASLIGLAGADKALELALCGGEDYELLFTVPPARSALLMRLAEDWNCNLACLGTVTGHRGVRWLRDGKPYTVPDSGFEHFA